MSTFPNLERNWKNSLEIKANQGEFERKYNSSLTQLKAELIKSFQAKIEYIRSLEPELVYENQKTNE
ncbi:unnamed protein product [Blepharisma stoltei]|uniref:Uncharacterized protein n=1 Tax=Blepharisma stoltei TaxID=1481888 RepID=A0AAU9I5G2_9CILI|nr:unnamed protein product [Blepharisma stoltei]